MAEHFDTWQEAHDYAQIVADVNGREMGIEKPTDDPIPKHMKAWRVWFLPRESERFGPDARAEVVRPTRYPRCLCCGSEEKARRVPLLDGRLFDVCHKCERDCEHCGEQLKSAGMPKGTVSAYEFLVRFQDGVESWERIQGSGGQIGNSCLYVQPSERLKKTLLEQAQNQAKREEGLRIWRNAESYKDAIKFHAGAEVLDIAAKWEPIFPKVPEVFSSFGAALARGAKMKKDKLPKMTKRNKKPENLFKPNHELPERIRDPYEVFDRMKATEDLRKVWPVGTRVRVSLLEYEKYAMGAAECLDGMRGTVEEVKPMYAPGGPKILVRFDEPAKTWWTHQTPPTAWHFDPEELQKDRTIQKTPVKDPAPVETSTAPFIFPYRGGKVVVQTVEAHIATGYTEGTDREGGDGPFTVPMTSVRKWFESYMEKHQPRIKFHDKEPDSLGRRRYVLFWVDPDGVFRPEPSPWGDGPVGYRRAQEFNSTQFTDPSRMAYHAKIITDPWQIQKIDQGMKKGT